MNKKHFTTLLAVLALGACSVPMASGADKTQTALIQIQTQLQLLQDNMARMQQSFDERMGVMKDMVTQQTDNVNKLGAAVQSLQKTLSSQTSDASSKVDQMSGQVQALHDAVDEVKARLAKVSKQIDDWQAAQQNISNPTSAQPSSSVLVPAGATSLTWTSGIRAR